MKIIIRDSLFIKDSLYTTLYIYYILIVFIVYRLEILTISYIWKTVPRITIIMRVFEYTRADS